MGYRRIHGELAGRTRSHRGAVHGVADPQAHGDRPGTAAGWPWLAGVPPVPGTGDSGTGLLHRRSAPTAPRFTSLPRSTTAAAACGFWAPPSIRQDIPAARSTRATPTTRRPGQHLTAARP